MADNTTINAQTGGDVIATDDIGGVKYPRSKLVIGADGVNDGDVSAANPMPVGGNVAHDAADSGNPQKIGFKASTALPTAVAANDRANGISDVYGRQLVTHKLPGMQVSKAFNATTTQTGAAIWTPTSGNRIVVTSITISLYGTTGGRVIVWFGGSADTTYTAGTDQPLEIMSGVPSATVKPGLKAVYPDGVVCQTVDHVLRVTTDAAVSIDITVHGYELVG